MRYVSTRGEAPPLGFEDALLAGLARDGGLYMPEAWPRLGPGAIADFAGKPFAEVAAAVIEAFAGAAIPRDELAAITRDAYARFGHPAVTPLVQIDRNIWILELFHGPTLAFKDLAMQLVARLMDRVLTARGQHVTVVGATSGDTGGAAIEAFRGSERVEAIVLFPAGRVSDVQRRMMTTATEANVHAVAIEGTFDDCQALVKGMFNDLAFRDRVRLAGVNSINWARVAAQVTYYLVAAAALGAPARPVSFAVPTGNFGDILAGYAARRMGLPVECLAIATNDNDILRRTWETGVYAVRGVMPTTSPSMDIQVSSNFERYLYEASGRDAAWVRARMGALAQSGRFELDAPALTALRTDFTAATASMDEVNACIRRVRAGSGYLLDPHTACGVVAAERRLADSATPRVVLATAHPAKFPDAIEAIVGERPPLPPRLGSLMTDPERITTLPNDLAAVEHLVEQRAESRKGAAA
ncbi:MAG TPA: threonine synthase [Hyphomicrobiaceae bacterium]|nr:threonine synthase [Hyphomicrobiaceae bacterium]